MAKAKMTPEEEAVHALNWDLGREGLSTAGRAEYDRLVELHEGAAGTSGTAADDGPDMENTEQEAYSRRTQATFPSAGAAARQPETPELRYMRQTRNATVFIAVVVGVVCVLSLAGLIIAGVQLSSVRSQLNNLNGTTTNSSSCASQGGTDPSC